MDYKISRKFYFLLRCAWQRRYLICLPIILLPIITVIISFSINKLYVAKSSILIQEPAMTNPFLRDFAVSTNVKKRMASLKALVHSEDFLTKVAEELSYINSKMSEKQKVIVVNKISKLISLSLQGDNVISLSVKSKDPLEAYGVLDKISRALFDKILSPQLSSIESSEKFLKEQLVIKRKSLVEAEGRLESFKTEHAYELPELYRSNITRLERLKTKLAEKEVEISGLKANVYIQKKQLSQTNLAVGFVEKEILKIKSELSILQVKYTDKHSKVKSLKKYLDELKKKKKEVLADSSNYTNEDFTKLWQLVNTMPNIAVENQSQPLLVSQLKKLQQSKNLLETLEQEVNSIKHQIKTVEPKVKSYGKTERALADLERDLDVKRKLYDKILERYEMAKVTQELGRYESNSIVSYINRPSVPKTPLTPSVFIFFIMGIMSGSILGVGLAAILEVFDTSIKTKEELQKLTKVPVIIRLPFIREVND